MDNYRYPQYDINIHEAWAITRGEGIQVAVIDEGVDLNHEDLIDNLLPGYDTTDGALGGSGGSHKGDDNHGTLCAGVIAAADNGIGITGVAPQSGIIPIRGAYSDASGNWVSSANKWLIAALERATVSGARVISNSWFQQSLPSTTYNAVMSYITSKFNMVVVCSAGNESLSGVLHPANHPNTIAVGAMSPCGERKTPASCDGEDWWGSNYGSALDVVAPGGSNTFN